MSDNYRTRRIVILTLIGLAILLLIYAFYRLLMSRASLPATTTSPQPPVSGSASSQSITQETLSSPLITPLPSPTAGLEQKIQEQTLMALTDFPVIAPMINKDQNGVLLYKKDGGGVYSIDFAGNAQKISNITILGLIDAIWSPNKDRAGVFYIDKELLKSFLHIGTSSVVSLPLDIKSFSWSPDGKQFAYVNENNSGLSLFILDAAAKSSKEVFQTPIRDAQIQWISTDIIAFQTAPSGHANGFVFLYSIKNGSFKKFLGPIFGLTTRWSPDASYVLVGSTNGIGAHYHLSLYDNLGNNVQPLDFITLPEKCTWVETKEFYCAVPQAFPGQAIMPDDYLRGELATQDRILSFNLNTLDTKLVFSGGAMDMLDLSLTASKDYLIFTNKTNGIPWRLKLTQ